jgi:hypothetical protein
VAVAANFTEAVKEIGVLFAKATGHKAVFSFGSTGQLCTQITRDRAVRGVPGDRPGAAAEGAARVETGNTAIISADLT